VDLALGIIVAVALVCLVCTIYLQAIYIRQGRPRSKVFRMLIVACWVIAAVGIYFSYAVSLRWLHLVPPPVLLTTAFIMALFTPPMYFAYKIWRLRRERGSGRPPPFAEDD
jgi:uncharacterized membrane protein YfcA